jgi:hypothetical protein
MRVALVVEAGAGKGGRDTVAALLRRPLEELGADLAALGHDVVVVEARRPAGRRPAQGAPSLEMLDRINRGAAVGVGPTVAVVRCARRKHLLEVLDPSRTDVALAVGRGAGELLERLAPDLQVPWVWSAGADDLRSAPGTVGPWIPRHAARVVVGSLAEADLLARAGADPRSCDVVPWELATPGQGSKVMGDVEAVAGSLLATSGAGGAGVSDVIRAVAVLPELRLSVAVDDAHAADTHLVDRWARLATGLRAGDRIRFVRVTSGEGLRVLVRSTDLVVSLPQGRPESSLISAAMWAGTPVVASDVPGVRELVESGTTGLLLPAGQPRRLARALRVVGRDTPARSTWAWSAHRRATERFDRHGTAVLLAVALGTARDDALSEDLDSVRQDRLDDVAVG